MSAKRGKGSSDELKRRFFVYKKDALTSFDW